MWSVSYNLCYNCCDSHTYTAVDRLLPGAHACQVVSPGHSTWFTGPASVDVCITHMVAPWPHSRIMQHTICILLSLQVYTAGPGSKQHTATAAGNGCCCRHCCSCAQASIRVCQTEPGATPGFSLCTHTALRCIHRSLATIQGLGQVTTRVTNRLRQHLLLPTL